MEKAWVLIFSGRRWLTSQKKGTGTSFTVQETSFWLSYVSFKILDLFLFLSSYLKVTRQSIYLFIFSVLCWYLWWWHIKDSMKMMIILVFLLLFSMWGFEDLTKNITAKTSCIVFRENRNWFFAHRFFFFPFLN